MNGSTIPADRPMLLEMARDTVLAQVPKITRESGSKMVWVMDDKKSRKFLSLNSHEKRGVDNEKF